MTDAWQGDDPLTFPVPWPDPGEELLPVGAHGLVADGQLHGFAVGKRSGRYTRIKAKLRELGLTFAELHCKGQDGTCTCHGMVWR